MGTPDLERITFHLLRKVTRAIGEFDLVADGDRVAVAVSGGKDSRALLQLLLHHRRKVPYWYDVVAVHIVGTPAGFPDLTSELRPWFQKLGVEHHFVPLKLPPGEQIPLNCFRCSWNRRKALFIAAVEQGCSKVAFGHHADDAAATVLLNLLFTGRLETMVPRIEFFDGSVTAIRPLIYLLEKELARYGRASAWSDSSVCPYGLTSKRAQMKLFLQQFGRDQTQIRANLWRAARQTMGF